MESFTFELTDDSTAELRRRLHRTRWCASTPAGAWDAGVPQSVLMSLVNHWADDYDWHRLERGLRGTPSFLTEIGGGRIHFLHVRSPEPGAVPLLLSHGWPGSVLEFLELVEPLTNPRAHGFDPGLAFHVVAPSPPGFGFSGPALPGWGVDRIASAWVELMDQLGYGPFFAHGTDFGTWVTEKMADQVPQRLLGAHLNFVLTPPAPEARIEDWPEGSQRRLRQMGDYVRSGSAYMAIQSTSPNTLAYVLDDSPAGLLAWVADKVFEWTAATSPENLRMGADRLLDLATLYWVTSTGGSSVHWYHEMRTELPTSPGPPEALPPVTVPVGVVAFANDICLPIREAAGTRFQDIKQWNEYPDGGHFPGLEVPEVLAADIRSFAKTCLTNGP